jgi:hypothetical protein
MRPSVVFVDHGGLRLLEKSVEWPTRIRSQFEDIWAFRHGRVEVDS